MIVVVDYGTANLKSVANALQILGADVCISNKKEDIENADKIVLPGVGSFAEGVQNLRKLDLLDILRTEVIEKKKPFLGICLGMHLLADQGYEGGVNQGLGFIPGKVKKIELQDNKLKIPHMGWDNLCVEKENPLLNIGGKDSDFYFVHSYHFVPDSDEYILATCDYGGRIVSAIQKDNILATQFHPEKSQQNGLKLLEKFIDWKPFEEEKC